MTVNMSLEQKTEFNFEKFLGILLLAQFFFIFVAASSD